MSKIFDILLGTLIIKIISYCVVQILSFLGPISPKLSRTAKKSNISKIRMSKFRCFGSKQISELFVPIANRYIF